MNGRDRIEAHIHYAAAFIGGFFGMYAILTRFMFGSAETMNMLSLVGDLLGRDLPDFLARLGALLIFSSGVALSVIITDNRPGWRNMVAFSADAAAVIALAFMPEDMNSIIALYPVFLATSMQWCLVKGPYGYAISSVFSTNNLRQFITGIVRKAQGKDDGKVSRVHAFGLTLLSFHAGAAAAYIAVMLMQMKGIWIALVPIAVAFALSFRVLRCKE